VYYIKHIFIVDLVFLFSVHFMVVHLVFIAQICAIVIDRFFHSSNQKTPIQVNILMS